MQRTCEDFNHRESVNDSAHYHSLQTGFIMLAACTCHVQADAELLHVQSLWGSVSGARLQCTMWGRKEDKQQAKPPSSTKRHFFMNISLSRRHHPFICSSIHPWPQRYFVSAHTHTQKKLKYWDNEFNLVRTIDGNISIPRILWETDR